MNQDLHDYIKHARDRGIDHQTIKDNLVAHGWEPSDVDAAMHHHMPHQPAPVAPEAPMPAQPHSASQPAAPIAVVQSYSTRGVEYFLMIIALAIAATSFGALLHDIAQAIFKDNSTPSFTDGLMSFAGSALIVSLPLFIFFFLRLKKAELQDSALKLDASRRRAIQVTLILSFLIGVFTLIGYVYTLFNAGQGSYGDTDGSSGSEIGLTIVDMIITLGIVGGIFAYYWIDSHPKEGRY
jgi:hypothetical protein